MGNGSQSSQSFTQVWQYNILGSKWKNSPQTVWSFERLTTRKLIKDFELQAKSNFKNSRSKVAPRSNFLGANNLKSVAICTCVTANFAPCHSAYKSHGLLMTNYVVHHCQVNCAFRMKTWLNSALLHLQESWKPLMTQLSGIMWLWSCVTCVSGMKNVHARALILMWLNVI